MSNLSPRNSSRFTLFTWSKQKGVDRTTITKARGVYFWDKKGKKYLDFASQLVNINLGHSHPRLQKAVIKQLKILDYTAPSFVSEPKVQLAKHLIELTGLGKVLFTTGGGEANENAIMIARQVSGKDIILSRSPSYHGATYGARTASRDETRNLSSKFDTPSFRYFSAPICSKKNKSHKYCCIKSLKELEQLTQKFKGKIAAVIIEPIPGAQGVLIPSKEYLPALVEHCRKNKIFVIFDEAMTGFGRTGKWFSYQHWNLNPDIVTLSKGINGGIAPLGAVVVSKEIAKYFDENKLLCGLTNSGHPVSCSAGVEAIRIYKKEHLIEKSAQMGILLGKLVKETKNKYSIIKDVRSIGLFCALEFGKSKGNSDPILFANNVSKEAFRLGLYLSPRLNCLHITPPLIIKQKELVWGMQILDKAIENALATVN